MGVLVVGDAQDPEGSFRFVADGPGGLGDVAGFEALKASMARLRKAAMARGAVPVWTVEESSAKVTF